MPPSVGIVWGVPGEDARLRLVIDMTPVETADRYGDCLTHGAGRYEVWDGCRRLGPVGLVRQGLPALIAWHEYEHFPRGRVVFDTGLGRFTFYADHLLHAPWVLPGILSAFSLDPCVCDVCSDPHCQTDVAC